MLRLRASRAFTFKVESPSAHPPGRAMPPLAAPAHRGKWTIVRPISGLLRSKRLKVTIAGSSGPVRPATGACLVTLERLQAQHQALRELSASTAFASFDVSQLARQITRIATSIVGVVRANVWLFNQAETELRYIDLLQATPARHTSSRVQGLPWALPRTPRASGTDSSALKGSK